MLIMNCMKKNGIQKISKRTNCRGYNVLNTLKHSQIIYAFRYHLPGALTNLELSPVVKGIIKEDTYRNGITYNRIFRINKKGEPGREMCSWAWFLFETEAEANDAQRWYKHYRGTYPNFSLDEIAKMVRNGILEVP